MPKSWFITGASSGFGRLLTEAALERGDRVIATVRKQDSLSDLTARYGAKLRVLTLDVTDAKAIKSVLSAAFEDRVDVVVSNAGYAVLGAAEELTDDQIDRQITTNLTGSINVLRAAVPLLRAQGGGKLVQLGSMGGQMSLPALSLYHTTKWGIEGFCESLAVEVAPFNISVTIVEPGGAKTNFAGSSADFATPLPVYEATPVGQLRQAAAAGLVPQPVDPLKVAAAILEIADMSEPPLRLALGGQAYEAIKGALTARLSELERHKAAAFAADVTS